MHGYGDVIRHVERGGSVKMMMNYYGEQIVEFRPGWLALRKVKVRLSEEQLLQLKAVLRRRRQQSGTARVANVA